MTLNLPEKPKRLSPFLPSAYLQALGNIAAYYAYLESAIEITIWAFLKLDYLDGTAVTAEMGAISRLQLLGILAERYLPHAKFGLAHPRFLDALKEIDGVRVRRNYYIHALWKHESRKSASHINRLSRSAKGKIKSGRHDVTLSELRALAIDIAWLTAELQGFVEAIFPDAFVPWPAIDD